MNNHISESFVTWEFSTLAAQIKALDTKETSNVLYLSQKSEMHSYFFIMIKTHAKFSFMGIC